MTQSPLLLFVRPGMRIPEYRPQGMARGNGYARRFRLCADPSLMTKRAARVPCFRP